ncbi:hypothetical protein ACTQ5F_08045 [Jeotgalibaca porci]|uniref:hypothetical protein n=1 Tax=Jeotgalibaca porci TaxID=1868793 RepID=UPI003F935DC2
MEFVKEWWFIIAFSISALGELYKMGKVLNETLLKLNFEIMRLSDSLSESKSDRVKLHSRVDVVDGRLDTHDIRISVLEDWRKAK